jgi:OOP family OmpA-OmpF porin
MRNIKFALFIAMLISVSAIANAQLVNAVVGVTGKVMNSETKEPEKVNIVVYDVSNKIINRLNSNSADGYYYIAGLKPGNTYFIEMQENGFFKEKYELNVINSDKYVEISRDFLVRPLKENVSLKIKVPPFEINKSKLRYGSALILEDITNTLKNNPKVEFDIVAYPDNEDNASDNLELTEDRANSLKDFFAVNGINPDRIGIKGNKVLDPDNPKPKAKAAKGKRYIGTTYLVITKIK